MTGAQRESLKEEKGRDYFHRPLIEVQSRRLQVVVSGLTLASTVATAPLIVTNCMLFSVVSPLNSRCE